MRRLVALALLLVAGGLVLAGSDSPAQGGSDYRVDAIFQTAKGLIPGQLVKIAGAQVGTIESVSLTPDYHARIAMRVDGRFAPFRSDASCQIRPQGLIAENFIDCDPGTPRGTEIRSSGGQPPTVALDHTRVPINLTDLFNVWTVPVRERLSVLVGSLGTGLAGRGEDLNQVIRQASPTLELTHRALTILDRQRAQVAGLVSDSDRVVAELARRGPDVQGLLDHAANVTATTAAHAGALAGTVHRLPALLSAVRPALSQLDALTVQATPLLADLRAAAPGLTRTLGAVGPFAAAGRPAIRALAPTLAKGRRVARQATPVVAELRRYAHDSLGPVREADALLTNLRQQGFIEQLLLFVYHAAAATARYDATSHILPAHFINSACANFATTPVAGCSANWHPAGGGTAAGVRTGPSGASKRRAGQRAVRASGPASGAAGTPAGAPAPGAVSPSTPRPGPLPAVAGLVPGLTRGLPPLPALPAPVSQAGSPGSQDPGLKALADYLLR